MRRYVWALGIALGLLLGLLSGGAAMAAGLSVSETLSNIIGQHASSAGSACGGCGDSGSEANAGNNSNHHNKTAGLIAVNDLLGLSLLNHAKTSGGRDCKSDCNGGDDNHDCKSDCNGGHNDSGGNHGSHDGNGWNNGGGDWNTTNDLHQLISSVGGPLYQTVAQSLLSATGNPAGLPFEFALLAAGTLSLGLGKVGSLRAGGCAS
jgi:hypothetical protein